jgi:hypothetical protein
MAKGVVGLLNVFQLHKINKLIIAVIQEEGNERSLEWSLNDDGVLDLYTE